VCCGVLRRLVDVLPDMAAARTTEAEELATVAEQVQWEGLETLRGIRSEDAASAVQSSVLSELVTW
jgi:hypothetical protein